MDGASLRSIHIGRIAPLGPDAIPSAFIKHAVDGAVAVGLLGLAGDEQADLSVHGGPDKAVYAYAAAHYDPWREDYPEHRAAFVAGGVGGESHPRRAERGRSVRGRRPPHRQRDAANVPATPAML
ncbi:MAG: hypothetical protein LH466_03350 [Sphingomonas bacterium]|nr:hypothetical protein [Sphingomonas bacterium]